MEDDEIPAGIRLSKGGINILIFCSTLGNSANERFAPKHFFNLKNPDAMLPLQLFNELVFPNDFADDHDEKSYHRGYAMNRFVRHSTIDCETLALSLLRRRAFWCFSRDLIQPLQLQFDLRD